jgi:parallel beta-helix repeat protein
MNGLLMTRTDSMRVQGNDFSYNSGLGVGLYRSSHNELVRNRLDYNVRGYSEGFYQRGQDSAGLLLYEQSSHNLVAYNSATHSGDGFFLWAGNSTMETGQGGANDNVLFHNDFSFAPTNAVEVTFSRNRIIGNLLGQSRYGVWGGYSWGTEIRGNCFAQNQFGVAIEHGQDNLIVGNRFDGDSLAISLWARPSQPPDWGYPRNRDVTSRDHVIRGNEFRGVEERWRLENTQGHVFDGNRMSQGSPTVVCDPREVLGAAFDSLAPRLPGVPREIPSSERSHLPRSAIVVDEWGPYDGRSPKLWPTDTTRLVVPLSVLGPPGRWKVTGRSGVARFSHEAGSTGDTLVVVLAPGASRDWSVELEYVGEATVSPRGVPTEAGVAQRFTFDRFEPLGPWHARFFAWADESTDPPGNPGAFESILAGLPFLTRVEDRLDYQWFRPLIAEIPQERWAVEATTSVALPPGEYTLRTISDDGVRVWVDGSLLLDHWESHGSEVHHAPLGGGNHEIRLQYYQLSGWAELRAEVVKGTGRSTGSAGPH